MINKYKNMIRNSLIAGILVIMLCSFVSATIVVSTEYHNENPLKMAPGETRALRLGWIQNTEDKEVTLDMDLTEGSEIATITNENLDALIIAAKSRDTPLNVNLVIPQDTAEGTEYRITIKLKDISPSEEGGMIGFTETKTINIPVLVQTEEIEQPSNNLIWIILIIVLIVIIIAIILLLIKKRKASVPVKK